MNSRASQAGTGLQRSASLLTSFRVLGRVLDWLTTLLVLNDEQQEQAGIHLSGRRRPW
jgi:hypothetical protein